MQNTNCRQEFHVTFHGPPSTPYEGGVWRIHVELPDQYPYKSPSIGFTSKIVHPNIDENSGSVCLDVINQAWSPMFDMINIFDVFLPQLLTYPNPSDPLNSGASSLMNRDHDAYVKHVRSMVQKYASADVVEADGDLSAVESELSSLEPSDDED